MRILVSLFISCTVLLALDTSMFFSGERTNGYSHDIYQHALKEKEKKEFNKITSPYKKPPKPSVFDDMTYHGLVAFLSESQYPTSGMAILAQAHVPLKKKYPDLEGAFMQGELLYSIRAQQSNTSSQRDQYLAMFGGYDYRIDELNLVYGKLGMGYILSRNSFRLGYGGGYIRKLKNDAYQFVLEISNLEGLWLISSGIQLKL